jgi:hypothetical protein
MAASIAGECSGRPPPGRCEAIRPAPANGRAEEAPGGEGLRRSRAALQVIDAVEVQLLPAAVPWASNSDLPAGVRVSLPAAEVQDVFREVVNGRMRAGHSEVSAPPR